MKARRAAVFALVLLASSGLITYGIARVNASAAWIAGGVLLAAWSWLVLSE